MALHVACWLIRWRCTSADVHTPKPLSTALNENQSLAPRFDNADVVAHIYRQLAREGYTGIPIHNLFRWVTTSLPGWETQVWDASCPGVDSPRFDPLDCSDEVQDFTQAELLIDLKVVADPNGLFL